MRIVAFTGYARSGKDTAAKALTGEGWTRVGFADALKDLALRINPMVSGGGPITLRMAVGEAGWDEAKQIWPLARKSLQEIGVGVRDVIGEDTWVDIVRRKLNGLKTSAVITDLRFPNEAEAVRKWGGWIIRIDRHTGSESWRDHVSETSIDLIEPHISIGNHGTIEDLHRNVMEAVKELQEMEANGSLQVPR